MNDSQTVKRIGFTGSKLVPAYPGSLIINYNYVPFDFFFVQRFNRIKKYFSCGVYFCHGSFTTIIPSCSPGGYNRIFVKSLSMVIRTRLVF